MWSAHTPVSPAGYRLEVRPGEPPPRTLRAVLAEADGLLPPLTDQIDAALLEAAPRLWVVSNDCWGQICLARWPRRGRRTVLGCGPS